VDSVQALVLALMQGVTEFLPISSSGHLIVFPKLFGWEDQGLAFDVAVHVGSLLAVLAYYRAELALIIRDTLQNLFGGASTEHSKTGWRVVLATIPVGVVGLLFGNIIESSLRNPTYIALAMILFALLMWWIDRYNCQVRDVDDLNWKDALLIGCAQAVALMPGVSRSGMTITMALLLGLKREAAAHISFLMAIPVIVLAGAYKTLQLMQTDTPVNWAVLALGVGVSAITAFVCIHWFLVFIRRYTMLPFAVYLLVFGGFVLYVFR
jgi:undecaprenyl-diphosphatase